MDKELIWLRKKQYKIDNKEKIRLNKQEYYRKNKEKLDKYQKQYSLNNKEKIKLQPSHSVEYKRKLIAQYGELYYRFRGIKNRCQNKNQKDYHYYGGRGIKCEWKTYQDFKNDMYESYLEHKKIYGKNNTSLDRIDNNGNYCKENCRWATLKEQYKNKRNTISIRTK